MPYRNNDLAAHHYYHIYNRGLNSAKIFLSEEHYTACLKLVQKYTDKYQVRIIAYCLMPTHYHFLMTQADDDGISRVIQSVFNAYVQSFNRMTERKGPLFEGRFKHKLIEEEEYLIHLCRYIHLNPVTAGLVRQPEEWIFSNYCDWIGMRPGRIVDRVFIDDHFESPSMYKKFVCEYQIDKSAEQELQRYLLD